MDLSYSRANNIPTIEASQNYTNIFIKEFKWSYPVTGQQHSFYVPFFPYGPLATSPQGQSGRSGDR